jgi:hypothetical protein
MRLITDLREDPAVKKWLSGYDVEGHRNKLSFLRDFIRYVNTKDGFKDATPLSLVEFQRHASEEDKYKILDILQEYMHRTPGTHKTLTTRYSTIKSLFIKNRASLPLDTFRIKATRDPVQGKLSLDAIKSLVGAADLDMKCVYLSLFMGILDQERFSQFNQNYGGALSEHLKSKGVDEPFFIEFSGRKQSKHKVRFYSFLGRDALAAWKEYFERIRGWP